MARRTTFPIIVSQNTQFGDNLDAVLGNHSLKVGFGVIFRQTNAYQSSFSRSQFVSTTIYTSNPAVTGISGNGAPDLLGLRTMANFFVGRPIGGPGSLCSASRDWRPCS